MRLFTIMLLLLLSRVSHVRLCVTPQTAAHQTAPSLGFSSEEHWSGFPFPSPVHESENEVAQSCPTRSNPMDCSLPGSSIPGIFYVISFSICLTLANPQHMIHSKLKAFSVGVDLVKSRLFSYYFLSFVGNKLGTVVSERGIYTLHQKFCFSVLPSAILRSNFY